jgi:hypothetical protein
VLQVLLLGVPAPRALATTRSPLRKEWAGRVARVLVQMAGGLLHRVRRLAATRGKAVVEDFQVCRDLIPR